MVASNRIYLTVNFNFLDEHVVYLIDFDVVRMWPRGKFCQIFRIGYWTILHLNDSGISVGNLVEFRFDTANFSTFILIKWHIVLSVATCHLQLMLVSIPLQRVLHAPLFLS